MRNILLIAVVSLSATVVTAADAPAKPEATARLGVIDMDRVATESRLGKEYAARIQALSDAVDKEQAAKEAALAKMNDEIKALQEDVDKHAALLSQDALERKQLEIKRKSRERQAFLDDSSAELQKMREKAQNQANALNDELQKKVRPQMQLVARQEGLDVLLDGRSAMAISSNIDISDKVIASLNAAPVAENTTAKTGATAKTATR